jgi:hypothetical protein
VAAPTTGSVFPMRLATALGPLRKFNLAHCPSKILTVPTIRFEILHVYLVLSHERRIVRFAVTAHPTAEWTAQQLHEGFPFDSAPQYLLRDRDRIFGQDFVDQVKAMGIKQGLSAPRSPWQRPISNGSLVPFAASV